MEMKVTNRLHFLEEIIIQACCAHMVVFHLCDDVVVDFAYGWSMIIIMNLHFMIVILWIMLLTKDMLRVFFKKYILLWRVWAVRKFGFRIGKKYHNYFNVTHGDRKVPQMMKLDINVGTDNLAQDILSLKDK